VHAESTDPDLTPHHPHHRRSFLVDEDATLPPSLVIGEP